MKEVKLLVKNKKLGGHIVFSEGIYRMDEPERPKLIKGHSLDSDGYDKGMIPNFEVLSPP